VSPPPSSLRPSQDRAIAREVRPGMPKQDRDAMTSLGRPPFRSRTCCWASGRTPPAQRKTKLPILHQQSKETWQ